jgi:DNA-binding MarR family transcriptional regulator
MMANAGSEKCGADQDYDPQNCTHTALKRASRQLTQLYDDALAPSGLTAAQALLTSRLAGLEQAMGAEGPTLQALAGSLSMQMSALTHALKPLVRDGLVQLVPDQEDKRSKRATLTAEGRRRTEAMLALWAETNRRVDLALGAGKAEELRRLAVIVAEPGFAADVLKAR